MADTRTYTGVWKRYEELKRSYNFLLEAAFNDDLTISQYAGPVRLSRLVDDVDKLLDCCSSLPSEYDRQNAQSAVIALLHSVELALEDACEFERERRSDFEDFVSSRPCPNPKIVSI